MITTIKNLNVGDKFTYQGNKYIVSQKSQQDAFCIDLNANVPCLCEPNKVLHNMTEVMLYKAITIKTSKLIEKENIALSITVTPVDGKYKVEYCLKEKTKNGIYKRKTIVVDEVIEDIEFPQVSNRSVVHMGYNIYKHLIKSSGFYINLYRI